MIHCTYDVDLPDAGEGMCCMGAAGRGPEGCTCWESVHDQEQQAPVDPPWEPRERATMCEDCAFRADSPERSGDERFQHSGEGELEELIYGRGDFACHQGMRRRLEMVHPTGVRVPCGPGAYDPLVYDVNTLHPRSVAFKADGTPADLCAGLAAMRRKLLAKDGGELELPAAARRRA